MTHRKNRTPHLTVLLLAVAATGLAFAQNMVVNGDFSRDLADGWEYEESGFGNHLAERRAWSPPDTGHYCFVQQVNGPGFARLSQLIDVIGPDLAFSYQASWAIGGGSSTCWPVAAVFLEYYDNGGTRLGETIWYLHNEYCAWEPSGNRHLISITDPDWRQYAVNVREEIAANLPAVTADAVRQVGISLYSYTSDG